MITMYVDNKLYSFKFTFPKMFAFIASGKYDLMNKALETENLPVLVKIYQDIILNSYCAKSKEDFIEFKNSTAFSKIFWMLARDEKASVNFMSGILDPSLKNPSP